jgi:hypothetical protein
MVDLALILSGDLSAIRTEQPDGFLKCLFSRGGPQGTLLRGRNSKPLKIELAWGEVFTDCGGGTIYLQNCCPLILRRPLL